MQTHNNITYWLRTDIILNILETNKIVLKKGLIIFY